MKIHSNISISSKGVNFTDKNGQILTPQAAGKKIQSRLHSWLLDFSLMVVHTVSDHVPFWFIRKAVFQFFGLKIGNSTIHMGARFYQLSGIEIGDDSIIGFKSTLDGRAKLKIGNHVDIASEVMLYNSEHDVHSADFSAIESPIEVSDYVFIGPRSIILPGVVLGEGSVVAAGAVVTKSVASKSIVGGIPAKPIGTRDIRLDYKLGRARLFC